VADTGEKRGIGGQIIAIRRLPTTGKQTLPYEGGAGGEPALLEVRVNRPKRQPLQVGMEEETHGRSTDNRS